MPLYRVSVPTPWSERRIKRAGRLMRKNGVRHMLAPNWFDQWELLAPLGLAPVEAGVLCTALAAPLALAYLQLHNIPPEQAEVDLRGSRVTMELERAARALCPAVRRVTVSAPRGGAELTRALLREYGMPELDSRGPDAALYFTPAECRKKEGELLLCGPKPDLCGLTLRPEGWMLPDGTESLALLCALWESGRQDLEKLDAVPADALDRPEQTTYNTESGIRTHHLYL
jgi:hypothetical protein